MDWHQLWTIASTPDNVPIVALLPLVIFYCWLAWKQARANDRLIGQLETDPAMAKTHHRKTWPFKAGWQKEIHVWPFLLRVEFLAAIIVCIILMVWSITLSAPLEEPANPNLTMNPAKAPWYFLGLQEMLVYFDPWLAGVVLPGLIIVGLMAIPYIDTNPKGSGYYSFRERKWEIGIFLYGFLVLWSFLIITGTFLRGPNWNFFGPYEYWDPNKLVPLVNIDLSELVWVQWLGMPLPKLWPIRELPGIALVIGYLSLPPLLARGPFRRFYLKMGATRYYVACFLFLIMLALPIKMILRWLFNLKYIVHIQEIFFDI